MAYSFKRSSVVLYRNLPSPFLPPDAFGFIPFTLLIITMQLVYKQQFEGGYKRLHITDRWRQNGHIGYIIILDLCRFCIYIVEGETDRQRGTERQSPGTVLVLRKTSSRLETVKKHFQIKN